MFGTGGKVEVVGATVVVPPGERVGLTGILHTGVFVAATAQKI